MSDNVRTIFEESVEAALRKLPTLSGFDGSEKPLMIRGEEMYLVDSATGTVVTTGVSFSPPQVIWLLELTSTGGSAIVTLTGVRRDTEASETIATYNLSSGETLFDANDITDHASFSWSKTGAGTVTARVR
jgi:hypothetical protein